MNKPIIKTPLADRFRVSACGEVYDWKPITAFTQQEQEPMEPDQLITAIKSLRGGIHLCYMDAKKLADHINRGDGGREVALAITKLEEAKMWLGKVLGARGTLLPEEYRDEPAERSK